MPVLHGGLGWEKSIYSIHGLLAEKMEEEKPRLSRLTAIITQLQSKRIVTAGYLAEKHNVSIRTIYRDIRTLEQSGIPIITEEGKGYSIMEGYHLPPVLFTEDEANALITVEQQAIRSKDESLIENVSSAIDKIKAILKYSQKGNADLLANRIYFNDASGKQKTSSNLMEIQSAIIHFRLIEITYVSSNEKRTQREIEPFAIYSIHGNFLLVAFCRLRGDFRVFRLDYIETLETKSETFTPHDMTIQEFFEKYIKNQEYP